MMKFMMGARATCTGGFCGVVRRTIINPAARTVTHLVIEPEHHHHTGGRLVPVELVEEAAEEIRLRCTLSEFGRLDPAEEVTVVEGDYGGGHVQAETVPESGTAGRGGAGAASGASRGLGLDDRTPLLLDHAVPRGETEVEPNDRVRCPDGEVGQVKGFVTDPADHKVTHIVLQEGHLWGRKEIAIPASAVASFDAGIQLNITKKEVGELSPPDPAG